MSQSAAQPFELRPPSGDYTPAPRSQPDDLARANRRWHSFHDALWRTNGCLRWPPATTDRHVFPSLTCVQGHPPLVQPTARYTSHNAHPAFTRLRGLSGTFCLFANQRVWGRIPSRWVPLGRKPVFLFHLSDGPLLLSGSSAART